MECEGSEGISNVISFAAKVTFFQQLKVGLIPEPLISPISQSKLN